MDDEEEENEDSYEENANLFANIGPQDLLPKLEEEIVYSHRCERPRNSELIVTTINDKRS